RVLQPVDRVAVLDHLTGERQPDAVDADLLEAADDRGHGRTVQAEWNLVGLLAGVVVGGVVDVAGTVPGAARTVPVAGLELEAVAVSVDDPPSARAQRTGPGRRVRLRGSNETRGQEQGGRDAS